MPGQQQDPPAPDSDLVEDPIYLHTRREAKIILSMWLIAMIYTCTYCYLFGYSTHPSDPAATGPAVSSLVGPLESFDRQPDSITTPLGLGIPDWVFYGVALPWLVCILVSIVFCLTIFKEDDLESVQQVINTTPEGASHG